LETADTVSLDKQLKALLPNSLKDPKTYELVSYQLFELVPQVDRICVTTVKDGKIRLAHIQERLGLNTSFRSKSTVVKAQGQSLADYAQGDKTVVNQSLESTTGSIMANMARKDIRSSMHVPVQIDGVPATINFWSAEAGAFPPEAVKILEQVARLMAGSETAIANN
jgi:hypothetical protein